MATLPADEWAIAPYPHLGDTYFTCALAEPFLARHGGSRVHVVVPRKLWSVLTLFPDARIAPLVPADVPAPFREGRGFRKGEPFHLHPLVHVKDFEEAYGGRSVPFTRTYHDLLELDFPSFTVPRVSFGMREAAARRLAGLSLPEGRTVLLVPISYSLATFSAAFWAELAAAFAAQGYVVATNVVPHELERAIPGTTPLPVPIEELIPVAELAGVVVASRCGVCDVLSSAETDLRVLYHRPQYDWTPLEGVRLLWDLGVCGLPDRARYFEMGAGEQRADFVARVVKGSP
jgi:hypothetical protein